MKKYLGLALAGALTVGFAATPAFAAPEPPNPDIATAPAAGSPEAPVEYLDKGTEIQKVMVLLKSQPDGAGDEAAGLMQVQQVVSRWDGQDGITIRRQFGKLVHGFSAAVPANKIREIEADPAVKSVTRMAMFYPSMNTANDLTQSTLARTKRGVDGQGLLVSIIDSGIDIAHQDFRLDDGVAKKMVPQAGWTDKIPYGWNFADNNSTVKDTGSQHGQHVAGIVAANAGKEASIASGRINGVAPNAQLLAMKVFPNDPFHGTGASEDDVIAAIEKSVELGADIINMSLGSPNGLNEGAVGEGRAIANAVKAGVQVIVASGNDGLNFSPQGIPTDLSGMLDNGSMGSPAASPSAFAVASINNSHAVASLAKATWQGGNFDFGYQLSTGNVDGAAHKLIDCGLGKPEDITAVAKGNWCLIKRGQIAFVDKFKNAISGGASGVIVYNSQGDSFVGMGGLEAITIPGASVFQSVGEKLKEQIAAGLEVKLTNDHGVFPNAEAAKASDFTSWGATPELEFKPQIAGIGGSVWSLANDNHYQNMSGTSMATPHIAGVFALGMQEYNKRFKEMSPADRGALLKVALSNTAQIIETNGVPLAPRQIGAGLAQTDNAIQTSVFATVNGQPNVPLRAFSGEKKFTVKLQNKGDKPRTFTAGGTCVLNEQYSPTIPVATVCSKETLTASTPSVTIPAGGETSVEFTVKSDAGSRHWIEGWTKFTSNDADQPSLSLPYMGFVGDWNAEPIVDHSQYDKDGKKISTKTDEILAAAGVKNTNFNYTSLYTKNGSKVLSREGLLGWISPNGDGINDEIFPALMLLRSARDSRFSILDKDGNMIANLGEGRDLQRSTLGKIIKERRTYDISAASWNGTIYDSNSDSFVKVPDSTYTYRIETRLSGDQPWQSVDLPFQTDTVVAEPIIKKTQNGTDWVYDLTFKDKSGVSFYDVKISDGQTGAPIEKKHNESYTGSSFTVSGDTVGRYIRIDFVDYAGNPGVIYDFVGSAIVGFDGTDSYAHPINAKSTNSAGKLLISDGKITLNIVASPDVKTAKVDGVPVAIADGKGSVAIPAAEGRKEVKLQGFDADGKEIASAVLPVVIDTTPPVVTVTKASLDTQGKLLLDANGEAVIEGTVKDERAKPVTDNPDDKLWLLDDKLDPVAINADGTFKVTVKPKATAEALSLLGLDGFNPKTYKFLNIGGAKIVLARPAETGELVISFDEKRLDGISDPNGKVVEPFGQGEYIIDRTYKGLEIVDNKAFLTLSGQWSSRPSEFRIQGKPVVIDEQRRFSVKIALDKAITSIPYSVKDAKGHVVEADWKFLYDSNLPGYELRTTPQISEDGAIYLKEAAGDVTLEGAVWDDAFGYKMAVNGNIVANYESIWDSGEKINKRAYKTTVKSGDKQTIRISLQDFVGNGIERSIPVVTDLADPVITADVSQVKIGQKILVKATDDHLATLTVKLDGNEVAAKQTKIVRARGAKVVLANASDPAKPVETLQPAAAATSTGSGVTAPETTVSETPAAATTNSVEVFAAPAESSEEVETVLVYEIDAVESGKHTLEAVATDRAGRVATFASPFMVQDDIVIEGPDVVVLNPDSGDLMKQLLEKYSVIVNGAANTSYKITADTKELKLDETVDLLLTAQDDKGNTVTRKVQVTLQRPEQTIKGSCGQMKARFSQGDSIEISCTKRADGTVLIKVKNKGPKVRGLLTLFGIKGPLRMFIDGKLVDVEIHASVRRAMAYSYMAAPVEELNTTAAAPQEEGITFESDSDAEYVAGDITAPGAGNTEVPGVPVAPGQPAPKDNALTPVTPATPGQPAKPSPLARTGADAATAGVLLFAVVSLAGGVVTLKKGRRRH
ncbi:MAG: S8 family serine peptidase [Propionibacteriaceae bacterium]